MPSKKFRHSRKYKNRNSRNKNRKTKTRRMRQTKRNKFYNMKGCSHKHKCSCHKGGSSPIGGLPIKGGGCSPGPLIGAPYEVDKGGNYFGPEYKSGGFDYQRQMMLRGGGFLPQNLTNVFRSIGNEGQTIYNGVMGYKAPVSPLPYEGQGNMSRL